MLADSPEAQIVSQLAPRDGEPVLDKGCVDPFVGTPLRDVLAAEASPGRPRWRRDPPRRRVGGTPRQRPGLQVSVVEDMCARSDPDFHDLSVTHLPLFGTVATAADVIGSWA